MVQNLKFTDKRISFLEAFRLESSDTHQYIARHPISEILGLNKQIQSSDTWIVPT